MGGELSWGGRFGRVEGWVLRISLGFRRGKFGRGLGLFSLLVRISWSRGGRRSGSLLRKMIKERMGFN